MATVYIETSIVSHASALPSNDIEIAALQQQARQWWHKQRQAYQLVKSQFVLDEVSLGDPSAAARRLEMLVNVPILLSDGRVEVVAEAILSHSLMPQKAKLDALHVAMAAVSGVQYLLTQNCKHIANARILPRVYKLLEEMGLPSILICTPVEFLGYHGDEI